MTRTKTESPPKPYPEFPFTAHPNGQWCKKIRGKLHYFGSWEEWQEALTLFEEQRDDLYAGRTPHARIFRRLANERRERTFTRDEVLALVEKAGVQPKAMIYFHGPRGGQR